MLKDTHVLLFKHSDKMLLLSLFIHYFFVIYMFIVYVVDVFAL